MKVDGQFALHAKKGLNKKQVKIIEVVIRKKQELVI
jgi:hypothetical protein